MFNFSNRRKKKRTEGVYKKNTHIKHTIYNYYAKTNKRKRERQKRERERERERLNELMN